MKASLVGIRQKIKRADQHIRTLSQLARAFRKACKCRVVIDFDPNTETHTYRIKMIRRGRVPRKFSIIAGEAIHQLRSSLDHLVSQLVILNGKTPTRWHAFPIFAQPPTKKQKPAFEGMIKGIPPAAKTAIESLQPYHRATPHGNLFLVVLRELDNAYKHRSVWIVGGALSGYGRVDVGVRPGKEGSIRSFSFADFRYVAPLKNGTRIGHFFGTRYVKVNVQTSVDVAVKDAGLTDLQPVIPGLHQLRKAVVKIIDDFEREFFL